MATQENPPIEFDVDGQTYSLRFGFAAIVRLERTHDKPIGQIIAGMSGAQMRFDDMLTLFHACMMNENRGAGTEDVTTDEAAGLIDKLGVERVGDLINQAIEESPLFRERKQPEPPRVRGAGPGKKAKAK